VNPIRCKQGASLLEKGEAGGERRQRGTALSMSTDRTLVVVRMVGAGRQGREHVDDERAAGNRTVFMVRWPEEPAGSSQSTHSSEETGNDRGAKGCRKEKP
jgi:hypothetical protein